MSYLMLKLLKYYLTNSWGGDKAVHTFPEGISPKVLIK